MVSWVESATLILNQAYHHQMWRAMKPPPVWPDAECLHVWFWVLGAGCGGGRRLCAAGVGSGSTRSLPHCMDVALACVARTAT